MAKQTAVLQHGAVICALALSIMLAMHPSGVRAQNAQAKPESGGQPASSAEQPSRDETAARTAKVEQKAKSSNRPFYVEFRARNAESYGHTFLIYGRLGPNGKILTKTVAGLHPFTESPVPWMIGHLVVVPSETGASDGDNEDQYVIARFRVALSPDEYTKVVGYIKKLQSSSPVWHAVLYNCNAFVGDVARFMGMEAPISSMLMPPTYIDSLRDLNISKTSGVTGMPIAVESAEKLRAEALKALEHEKKPGVASNRRPAHTENKSQSPNGGVPNASATLPILDRTKAGSRVSASSVDAQTKL